MSYTAPKLPFRVPHIMDGDLPTIVTDRAIFYPYSATQIMVIRRSGDHERGMIMTHAEARRALRNVMVPVPSEQTLLLQEWNRAR